MRNTKQCPSRDSRGQSLIETALMMPLMLIIVLNAVNFGYFFFVTLNLSSSSRSGVEYSIEGSSTPSAQNLPAPGPAGTGNGTLTVTYVAQQDLNATANSTTAGSSTTTSVQICSQTSVCTASGSNPCGSGTSQGSGLSNIGTTSQRANCVTCTGTTCASVNTGSPGPDADPESPSFVLNRVDVIYTFNPLIPGRLFNLFMLANPTICSGATCTFNRHVEMRAMN